MQNFLLTIASAIILAIAAAFAAPLVIDWTQWRSTFEAQAARAVGAPVAIRGKIDAQILPTPTLVLRDVAIGSDAAGTGVTISEVQGTFQLSALFRGAFVADHLTLVKPRGRLMLDAAGKLALPAKSAHPAGFTAARLTVQNGTLDVTDGASGRAFRLDDIDLTGDVGAIAGPLRLDGEIESDGVRRKLKLGLAAPEPAGGSRLRFTLQDVKSALSLEADGMVRLAGGQPSFDGKASLGLSDRLRSPAANAPALRGSDAPGAPVSNGWTLSGTVNATPALIEAGQLSLTLGSVERPIELSGSGRLIGSKAGQSGSKLELALAARQIDLNAATANAPPLAALNAIATTIAPLADYAATGALDLSSDTVLISGAAMREVRVGLDWSGEGWRARNIEARLPGRASVKLAGRLPQPGQAITGQANAGQAVASLFSGDVSLNAEDLPAFAGWAAPESITLLAGLPTGGAKLDAAITIGDARIDLSRMTATMGEVKLTGRAGYA
ncbi:MAG TPA: AsmA family protein, partial [Ancylobacter sp.]